jgi:putative phage-type endonuclease
VKIRNLLQGSPEWLAYRAQHFNASDAPAMMGCSPYKTRAQLLRELHTGIAAEVDAGTQKRYDNGHRAEALARPLAEQIVGEDLYPVTGSEGRLSASFDGLTLDESEGFEHKAINDELRAAFRTIETLVGGDDTTPGEQLPLHHRIQMEQQLHISGARRMLFMSTGWTADGELIEEHSCWYYGNEELRAQILRGWDQFAADLAAYVLPDAAPAAPVGQAPETLPALRIEVTGQVTASNLAEFKATALGAIRSVNRELTTDQHFADAEKAVKWCADVEQRIAAAKEHALSQTASIDALFKTLDDIASESKRVRLDLDKLVTRRKSEVKDDAVAKARRALEQHIAQLNAEIAPMRVPQPVADFAAAIKGKRSISSMQDALDQVLTVAKIAAEADARGIRANVATFQAQAAGLEFLFHDLGQIVHKAADDFGALLQARIATHRAAEAQREAKRKADEEARIQAEAARQAAAMAEQQRRADAAAAEAQRQAQAALQAAAAPAPAPVVQPAPVAAPAPVLAPRPAPAVAEQATLNLGMICGRLGFTVSAAFLADVLHVQPARTDKASKLYTESQFGVICQQLVSHVGAMRELYSGEVAA